MRVPGVRFRLHTMLVAMAVVAVGLGVYKLRQRSKDFLAEARAHAGEAGEYQSHAELWERGQNGGCMEPGRDASGNDDFVGSARGARRRAAYEAELSRKYLHAAAHPWLSVEPDPPKPW